MQFGAASESIISQGGADYDPQPLFTETTFLGASDSTVSIHGRSVSRIADALIWCCSVGGKTSTTTRRASLQPTRDSNNS